MQPVLQTNATPVDPNLNAGILVRADQTRQSTANPVMEFWDRLTAQVTYTFNNFFFEQPSIAITLPGDMLARICTNITEDKDLYSFTLTCKVLCKMRAFPQIQPRIFKHLFLFGETLTCQQLNEKATQLTLAVDKRLPSDQEVMECYKLKNYIPSSFGLMQTEVAVNLRRITESYEVELYNLLKTRCAELKINQNNGDFTLCATFVIEELKKNSSSLNNSSSEIMYWKLNTTILNFNRRIFDDLIHNFARQPISTLTPFRFKEQVKKLKALCPNNPIAQIEASLRRTITAIPANRAAMFASSIAALLDADPEAQQLNLFLNELLMPIAPGQEMTRSAALHVIIG